MSLGILFRNAAFCCFEVTLILWSASLVLIFVIFLVTCSLPGEGTYAGSGSSKVVHAQKIEPVTVSELNQFVISAEPQVCVFS